MRKARAIKFVEFENGCMVALSHAMNKDGYFRKIWGGKGGWLRVMMHRAIWELRFGKIPEGYEINHKCRNRGCCNTDHLEVLDRTTHLVKTNKERYKPRKDKAKQYWLDTKVTGTQLAKEFGVSFSTGCNWIRSWADTH